MGIVENNLEKLKNKYIGKRFNSLTILDVNKENYSYNFISMCDCGKTHSSFYKNVLKGKSKSCASCAIKMSLVLRGRSISDIKKELTPFYSMVGRCYNKNNQNFKEYGERGIIVCDRWLKNPRLFVDDMGERPSPKHSIDRIDVNGNYEPSNCKWSTQKEQCANRRNNIYLTIDGKRELAGYWSDKTGVPYPTILHRKKSGLSDRNCILSKSELKTLKHSIITNMKLRTETTEKQLSDAKSQLPVLINEAFGNVAKQIVKILATEGGIKAYIEVARKMGYNDLAIAIEVELALVVESEVENG